jgi:apolipoprotein N-acyltransferase
VLPPAARVAAAVLRAMARLTLLAMGVVMLSGDSWLLAKPLVQIRLFTALVLVPELAAWLVLRAFQAHASVDEGALVLARGVHHLTLPLREIAAVQVWRLPWPAPGVTLRMASGQRHALAGADPVALQAVLGSTSQPPSRSAQMAHAMLAARADRRRWAWLAHPAVKFFLLPLLIAMPAFRLHQQIAYGGSFGEWQTFGAPAWLIGFGLWWAAWIIGVSLTAAVVRAVIEGATVLTLALKPSALLPARRLFERVGLAVLYLGLPAWLMARVVVS